MDTRQALVSLLPSADDDILEYLTATVDQALEDGESLNETLSELLISYDLAGDDVAAEALCTSLGALVVREEKIAPPPAAAVGLLRKPFQMGDGAGEIVAPTDFGLGCTTDVYGNSTSFAARANASAASANLNQVEGELEVEEEEENPCAFGLLLRNATTSSEQEKCAVM